jgi:uncharacterized protein YukE
MTDRLEEVWEDLKTQRDELKVQIHLAQADLRDELEALEPKWESAQENFKQLQHETEHAAQEVKHALGVIADELGTAYKKIKSRLKEDS